MVAGCSGSSGGHVASQVAVGGGCVAGCCRWWWRRELLQVVASRVAAGGGVAVVRCGGRVGVFVGLVGCCCSSYKVRVRWCEIKVGKGRD